MYFDYNVLEESEKITFALRSIYKKYGYRKYKMSKFEEYDLYSSNKDFLVSDSVITFTDTNGKLMALKPDVTLSIIKNSSDTEGAVHKIFYNENVYRISKGTGSFKEIPQAGVECIGAIDEACISEVIGLAEESLKVLEKPYAIEISNLDILKCFVGRITDNDETKRMIMKCICEKNVHELYVICKNAGADESDTGNLVSLLGLFGNGKTVLPKLKVLCENNGLKEIYDRFEKVIDGLDSDGLQIDFSVTGDINYYNGIVFKGYIEGIPDSIISGGQYGELMKKMGKKSKAIGFAVYLDLLERLDT